MADPDFASVSLLLRCNGADESLTLTDHSSHEDHHTIDDGAEIDTSISKWGGASLHVIHAEADIAAWTGSLFARSSAQAFSVEHWLRPTANSENDAWLWAIDGLFLLHLISTGGSSFVEAFSPSSDDSVSISEDAWHFLQFIVQTDNSWAFLVDEVVLLSGSGASIWTGTSFTVAGAGSVDASPADYRLDDFRVTKGVARSTDTPTEEFPSDLDAADLVDCYIAADGPLGAAAVLVSVYPAAFIAVDGPLGAAAVLVAHDFTSAIGAVTTRYVMDLTTPGGTVRVPISSWQATLQTQRACFVQCVVSACTPYLDDILAATAFTILRRAVLSDGAVIEYTMASAEISNVQPSRGPFNHSAVMQGYTSAFATDEDPSAILDRTLTGIRFTGASNGVSRVRCAIDWLLRPGQRAFANGDEILVGSINYYATDSDQYMEVGEQEIDG